MTYKRKNSTQRLPRLVVPTKHTSPDLKGAQYPHLPPVGQIDGTSSDEDEVVTLLPAIGEPHPCPYFNSATVNLRSDALDTIQVIGGNTDNAVYVLETFQVIEADTDNTDNTDNAVYVLDDIDDDSSKTSSLGPTKEDRVSQDLTVEKPHRQFQGFRTLDSIDSSFDNYTIEAKPEDDENTRGVLEESTGTTVQPLIGFTCWCGLYSASAFVNTGCGGLTSRSTKLVEDKDLEWLWLELDVHLRNVVWIVIEEKVRLLPTIKQDEVNKKTSQLDENQQMALYTRGFKKNYLQLDATLNNLPLQSLISELHLLTVQEKLMQNHLLEPVQDDVISQKLADKILDSALKEVELQGKKVDEEERKAMPERIY